MPNLDEDASLKWLDDGSSDDEEGENVAAAANRLNSILPATHATARVRSARFTYRRRLPPRSHP